MSERVDWVSPFERIAALHDARRHLVQVYEDHSRGRCRGAAAWSALHYKDAGGVVLNSWRDGARDVFLLREGEGRLELAPSSSPAGIERAVVQGDSINITYAGLGGGGVGAARCRGLAAGVEKVEIEEPGGGGELGRATLTFPRLVKLHAGIDDTDRQGEGATWSLANELGYAVELSGRGYYLDHTLVQLYPNAPGKTANCVATALTFAVIEEELEVLVSFLIDTLKASTLSDDTGLALMTGIQIPDALVDYSDMARQGTVDLEDARKAAAAAEATLVPVTGERGLIGALAAIGYAERHEEAVRLK